MGTLSRSQHQRQVSGHPSPKDQGSLVVIGTTTGTLGCSIGAAAPATRRCHPCHSGCPSLTQGGPLHTFGRTKEKSPKCESWGGPRTATENFAMGKKKENIK